MLFHGLWLTTTELLNVIASDRTFILTLLSVQLSKLLVCSLSRRDPNTLAISLFICRYEESDAKESKNVNGTEAAK